MHVMSCITIHRQILPMTLAKIIKNSGILESAKMDNNPQARGILSKLSQPCIFSLDIKRECVFRGGKLSMVISPLLITACYFPITGLVIKLTDFCSILELLIPYIKIFK